MSEAIPITPSVIKWARERSGYTIDDIAKVYKKIEQWEKGESFPTYSQLEKLSQKYNCPLAVFFFPEPPDIESVNQSFRTLPDSEFQKVPPEIQLLLRKARAMQMNLGELYDGVNPSDQQIIRDLRLDLNLPLAQIADETRKYLGITLQEQCNWSNASDAFDRWREILTNHGLFIFKDAFKNNEFSGFSLYDVNFPIIYVNNSHAKTRQIFTLFHELAHLLFNTSGIDKPSDDFLINLDEDQRKIEIFCNEFAGAFLVPDNDFNQSISRKICNEHLIIQLSEKYKVSREVILRKLLDREQISQEYYKQKSNEWMNQIKSRKTGGDYYYTQITYLGRNYIDIVLSKYHQNKISIDQLSEYLDIKIKNLDKFEERYIGRGA